MQHIRITATIAKPEALLVVEGELDEMAAADLVGYARAAVHIGAERIVVDLLAATGPHLAMIAALQAVHAVIGSDQGPLVVRPAPDLRAVLEARRFGWVIERPGA